METVKMKWSNTTICLFEHRTNLFLLIEIPVIGASELSSGGFLPSEMCMSNGAKTIQLLLNSLREFLPELFKSVLGGL